jgi:hypothetical protein
VNAGRESAPAIGRFLILAAKAERTASEQAELRQIVDQHGIDASREASRKAHVEAVAADALWRDVPECRSALSEFRARNEHRVGRLQAALREVTSELPGIDWCAIEGAAVLLGGLLPAAAYSSGDLDFVFSRGAMPAIRQAFARCGFVSADRRGRPTTRVEFRRGTGADAIWLEAGDEPFDRMWVPLSFSVNTAPWLARRVPSRVDPGLYVLDPTDTLFMCLLHASMHSFVRPPGLRLYAEIDRAARATMLDWNRLLREARDSGAATRISTAMEMAANLMGTPFPDDVREALRPSRLTGNALGWLLARDGGVTSPGPKLGVVSTIALDWLLDDRSSARWVSGVLFPPTPWLAAHFGATVNGGRAPWKLHARRISAAFSRWRPE